MREHRLHRPVHEVAPRFRCLVCRVFVTGAVDGTCPRCGWRPPSLVSLRPARRRRVVVPGAFAFVVIVAASVVALITAGAAV
jgi:hypothetical protein